jgi:hypothetical protein
MNKPFAVVAGFAMILAATAAGPENFSDSRGRTHEPARGLFGGLITPGSFLSGLRRQTCLLRNARNSGGRARFRARL